MSSLRPHGPPCPAPVHTLVEHKRDVVGIDPPRPTQLEVWFAYRLPPPPKAAWISTNKERYSTHLTAVAQKEPQVAQTQAAGNRRISQRILPEEQHLSTGNLSCCTAPPQDFHRSTFSFSESRTAFSFAQQKKKWFWPQPGRQKTNCKIKTSRFPAREKAVSPARYTPHP